MGKWNTIINITVVTSVEQINRADNSTFKENGRGFVTILYFQFRLTLITNICLPNYYRYRIVINLNKTAFIYLRKCLWKNRVFTETC